MDTVAGNGDAVVADGDAERVMHPLRGRHRELRPHLESLLQLADAVGDIPLTTLRQRLDEVCEFLTHELIPHASAENEVIFPLVARVLGNLEPTSMLSRAHVEIGGLTQELAVVRQRLAGSRMRAADAKQLRRALYGLSALLRVHLEQEEIYIALLEANLGPEELRGALDAMADAESRVEAPGR